MVYARGDLDGPGHGPGGKSNVWSRLFGSIADYDHDAGTWLYGAMPFAGHDTANFTSM